MTSSNLNPQMTSAMYSDPLTLRQDVLAVKSNLKNMPSAVLWLRQPLVFVVRRLAVTAYHGLRSPRSRLKKCGTGLKPVIPPVGNRWHIEPTTHCLALSGLGLTTDPETRGDAPG